MARVAEALRRGRARLSSDQGPLAALRGLLEALSINPDSQTLVFAKNSLQSAHISPQTPRAIYFNDSAYVGFIPGADLIELAAVNPQSGLQFYSMHTRQQTPVIQFEGSNCIACHGRPGRARLIVESVIPDREGRPMLATRDVGPISTDHRTPLSRRWGGWYVTGTHGTQRHMGNAVARTPFYPFDLEQDGTQNRTSVAGKFAAAGYPVATSDIVALMTLEHQAHATNLLTRLHEIGRRAIATRDGSAADALIDELAAYMTFGEEAPLRAPIAGVTAFAKTFAQGGPRDNSGRSLRDFNLQTRLFAYPLSYMIYSDSFDALPVHTRTRVYRRLYESLRGGAPLAGLFETGERRAAIEILRDTKSGLPAFWRSPK